MASVILPTKYDGRSELDPWLQHFAICAKANGWDETVQGDKMPAFLTGEALVVYLEMPSDQRTCNDVKAALAAAFSPPEQQSEYLLAFETLTLRDGESPRSFLSELRRLLDLAIRHLSLRHGKNCCFIILLMDCLRILTQQFALHKTV